MQYIEGQTLAQVIDELRKLDGSVLPPEDQGSVSRLVRSLTSGSLPPPTVKPVAGNASEHSLSLAPEISSTSADTQCEPQAEISTEGSIESPEFFRSVARMGIQAAEALEHAHGMGVVHRDIKPSNLLLDTQGQLFVTDFGLATTQTDASLTLTGDILGTLRYMSPEQVEAKHGAMDHRTDLYSLGVTLYELLTLRPSPPGTR